MAVSTYPAGTKVTAAMFNAKLEAEIETSELADLAVTSPKLASGAVTAAKLARQPTGQVKRTTNQTGIVTGTNTAVSWETAAINSDNMYSAGAPTRLTIQTAGLYLVRGAVSFEATATGIRRAFIRVNNVAIIALEQRDTLGASFTTIVNVGTFYVFSASDYIELVVFHDRGSDLSLMAASDYAPVLTATRLCS